MPENNSYLPKPVRIVQKTALDLNNILYRLEPIGFNAPEFKPGQFCLITIPGIGESAISFASKQAKSYFEIGVRRTGSVTAELSFKQTGEIIGFTGPFGNGFPIESMLDKNILIITGGCGIHPFRSLIQYISSNIKNFGQIRLIYGAKNPSSLLYKKELNTWNNHIQVYTTVDETDEKWDGETGLVANLLEKHIPSGKNTVALLCGPQAMFRSSLDILIKNHYDPDNIFVSLERRMKCAIGKCQHCVCGYKYVCIDWPIFSYRQLLKMPGAI